MRRNVVNLGSGVRSYRSSLAVSPRRVYSSLNLPRLCFFAD